MSLDVRTLFFVLGQASLVQVVALYAQYRASHSTEGLGWWTLASASYALGFLAIALRGPTGLGPFAIIANILLFLAGAILNYVGVLRFFKRKVPVAWLAGLLGGTTLVSALLTLPVDHMPSRRVVLSLAIASMSFLTLRALRASRTPAIAASVNFLSLVFGVHGSVFVLRALMPFLATPANTLFAATPMQVGSYLATFAGGLLWSFGFIILMNQRLNAETMEAGEHFEAIFNTSPDAVMITRVSDGRVVDINEGFTALTGYGAAEVLGRTTRELGIWDDARDRERMEAVLVANGFVQNLELQFRSKDQRRITGLFTAKPVALHGQPHILSVTQDITERKLDAQRIQELVNQLAIERDYAQASARTDALTRLANRGQFDEILHTEFYRLKRSGGPLSLILLDVDHFKNFNDLYGHLAGDDCLRRIGRALKAVTGRPSDLPARYGGEEFAVVLPETGLSGARALAERIRGAVEGLAIPHGGNAVSPHVTVSLGTVTRTGRALASPDKLIQLADQALYQAKQGGRNRVEVAEGDASEATPDLIRLLWRESAECGNAVIDAQHRGLFEDANALLSAILGGQPPEATEPLMDVLLEHIRSHFEDEEAILRASGYPQADDHAQAHAELLERAGELAGSYRRGDLPLGELFSFLAYEVVAQHLLREDRKFFPYV